MEKTAEVTRNYKDLFSYKKFVQSTMIPKYFPDEDISTLNVGLMGLVTEQTGIVIEDTFNAVSTMHFAPYTHSCDARSLLLFLVISMS